MSILHSCPIILYNVFTPTRNALDSSKQGTHKYMTEHEDTYVVVVEKHTLDGTNTFLLMKRKRKGHMQILCKSYLLES